MTGKTYLYILVCAAVSFLIRELPLTLIRRPIKSRFLRSFLFYVPYVTLAVDRKSTRLNSSHYQQSRMPSSA